MAREVSLTDKPDLSKRLREVHGLHEFAELFGFDWTDESDWGWHDVACAMADAVDVATAGNRSCASCPEMDNPDSYIVHLQSALKWHDEHVPRPTNPRNTCVVLKGERPPEEVLFVREDGEVTHYLPERVCKVVIRKRRNTRPWIHHYSCGYDFYQYPDCPMPVQRYCPNCGGRIVKEEAE